MKYLSLIIMVFFATFLAACSADKADKKQNQALSIVAQCDEASKSIEGTPDDKDFLAAIDVLGKALDSLAAKPTPEIMKAAVHLMHTLDFNEAKFSDAAASKYWDLTQTWYADSLKRDIIIAVQQATLTDGMSADEIEQMSQEAILLDSKDLKTDVDPTADIPVVDTIVAKVK